MCFCFCSVFVFAVSRACTVLVMCANDGGCQQVYDLLVSGSRHLAYDFYKSIVPDKMDSQPEPSYEALWQSDRICMRGLPEHLQV